MLFDFILLFMMQSILYILAIIFTLCNNMGTLLYWNAFRNKIIEIQSLAKHRRVHTEEKPAQCTICIYAFVYKSIYCDLRYLINHTRGKLCSVCKFEFFNIYAKIKIKYKINRIGEKPYWRFKCHHSLQCNYFKSSLDNKHCV